METLILQSQNAKDLLLIIQLAERLGIVYKQKKAKPSLSSGNKLAKLAKPLRKKTSLEDLKKEQNYKGVDFHHWNLLVEELDIPQTAEELIQQL